MTPRVLTDPEEIAARAREDLALLTRYAEAESLADRGGRNVKLEQAAWRAVERLLAQLRDDVQTLWGEIQRGGAR